MPKTYLRTQILAQLEAELALQTNAAQLAHDEATSEESRAENKYDTHSQEAAYLAEGQAKLATEAGKSINAYRNCEFPPYHQTEPISIGALVTINSGDQTTQFLIGPRAGGLELVSQQHDPIHLITPQSPLGGQMIGKRLGDSVILPGKNRSVQTITDVQ